LPVKVAVDGKPIDPNQIYVGGSDDLITNEDARIRTRVVTDPSGTAARSTAC